MIQPINPTNECICKPISKNYWCKHIDYLQERIDGSKRYSWWIKHDEVKKNWKYCPICATPRPSNKKSEVKYDLRLVRKKNGKLEWKD